MSVAPAPKFIVIDDFLPEDVMAAIERHVNCWLHRARPRTRDVA
jgi:hypothetical protein